MDICTDKDSSDLCVVIVAFTVYMLKKKQLRLVVVKILNYRKNLNVFVFYCFQTFTVKRFGSQNTYVNTVNTDVTFYFVGCMMIGLQGIVPRDEYFIKAHNS
jgi:hypothetical protein